MNTPSKGFNNVVTRVYRTIRPRGRNREWFLNVHIMTAGIEADILDKRHETSKSRIRVFIYVA